MRLLVVFACSTILVPAHPSLQGLLAFIGVPAKLVAVTLAAPLLSWPWIRTNAIGHDQRFILMLLAFSGWMLLRAAFSEVSIAAHYSQTLVGLAVLMPLATVCALIASLDYKVAAKVIGACGLVALCHFLYLFLLGGVEHKLGAFRALSGDAEKANYQATSFYVGLVAIWLLALAANSPAVRATVAVLGTMVALITMSMVGARASLIAALAVVVIVVARLSRRSTLGLIMAAIVSLSMLGATVFIINSEDLSAQLTVVNRIAALADGSDSSTRGYLFSSAISMWLWDARNFMIGGGVGSFPSFIGQHEEGWYPHNFFLEALAEGGIIGGALLLSLIGHFGARFVSAQKHPTDLWFDFLGLCAIFSLIAYQFMGGLQTLWIPLFFVALYIFSYRRKIA